MANTQNTTIVDANISAIKNMLEEFEEKVNKCNNEDIISFSKTIGEEFCHANSTISSSMSIRFGRKLELGEEILKLEHKFGELNEKFNKCRCKI